MPNDTPQGCLFAIFRFFRGEQSNNSTSNVALPYRLKDFLLSKAEASYFGVLNQVVDGRYLIFAKVRLADLLYLPKGTASRQAAFNRIQSKHVDFLLCHANGIRPCLAIELDDATHDQEKRVTRDEFLVSALAAAGLPLLRVRASNSYNPIKVREDIAALALRMF